MKKTTWMLLPAAAVLLVACSSAPSPADYDRLAVDMTKNSFQDKGIAKVSRLEQDEANRLCSAADTAGQPLDEKVAKAIEEANLKTVKWPSDGKFLGDWKAGETLAMSMSPYAFNPFNLNPLKRVLDTAVDFDAEIFARHFDVHVRAPAILSGNATLSNADRCGTSRNSWKTTPIRRLSAGKRSRGSVIASLPNIRIAPRDGRWAR